MATRLSMVVLVVMALAALLQSSTAQTTHVVGNSLGWTIPPGGPIAYSTWAAQETFTVGDILVFNFTEGEHNVAKVTKAAFDSCNGTAPISLITTGPANITLDVAGEHYFICTFTGHCNVGQKLAINVSAATSPAPQSPEAAPTPVPSRAPMTYNVGDSMGWIVPPGGPIAYQTWAYNKTFIVQDTLVFNFTEGVHDVAEVTKEVYLSCNITATISNTSTSPARIVLSTAGEHYFTSTFPRQCILGQKLAINVTTTSTASPPSPTAPAPSPTAPAPSPTATPPSSIATPPSSTATPPSSPASPPSTSSTPPSTSTSPPSSITPITPGPTGSGATPPMPASSAPSFVVAGFPAAFLSIVMALLF